MTTRSINGVGCGITGSVNKAGEVARSVKDVKSVKNNLIVK